MEIHLEEIMDLKGGENRHLKAKLLAAVDENGNPMGKNIFSPDADVGAKVRDKGWTNVGDMSACVRTIVGLDEVYGESKTPYIAVAAKHTRPVILAAGETQLEATIKAIAGDVNSPFGGFWGFNKPVEYETAKFLDKVFLEGVVAPNFEKEAASMLQDTSKVKSHQNRFLVETGSLSRDELNVFKKNIQPVTLGYFLVQDLEEPFDARKESVVVTANNGKSNISSLGKLAVEDINFAGNAALYLGSNLVFFVYDKAIAGLGDACGARSVAAQKARTMLEDSVYAAKSDNSKEKWEAVLFDTPFTMDDFKNIHMSFRLLAFSDAFYPKPDGFVETAGIDRRYDEFRNREVRYPDGDEIVTFIPKRDNYDKCYDPILIPRIVVQPGGSTGDEAVLSLAEKYAIKMVFTMSPEMFKKYQKAPAGKKPTGRRSFGHIIM